MIKKKKHHIGSHNTSARPDEKVGRRNDLPHADWSTPQRQTVQHVAAKKRRQRDSAVVDEQLSDQ